MKILNKENNKIIDVKDKNRIEKLLGYPDRFEEVKGKGVNKKEEVKEEIPVETKEETPIENEIPENEENNGDIKNEEKTPVEDKKNK